MGWGVGHKIVDTFEKMDAINPTFDRPHDCSEGFGVLMKIRFMYFSTLTIYLGWGHLFNKSIPILTEWWAGVMLMLWVGAWW